MKTVAKTNQPVRRGRPPRTVAAVATRGRGRPKGSTNKAPAATMSREQRRVDWKLRTAGTGDNTAHARAVRVTKLRLLPDDGKLQVFFRRSTWLPERYGAIESDPGFITELKQKLKENGIRGLQGENFTYGEADGSNFVTIEVAPIFAKSFVGTEQLA